MGKTKREKMLLALELDHTVVNTQTSTCQKIQWLGDEQFWNTLLNMANVAAIENGFELIVSLLSSKNEYDYICHQAHRSFAPYLATSKSFSLITVNDKNFYQSLNGFTEIHPVKQSTTSIFMLNSKTSKACSIFRIALCRNIPLDHCILMDSDPVSIKNAQNKYIQTIDFENFKFNHNPEKIHPQSEQITSHLILALRKVFRSKNPFYNQKKLNFTIIDSEAILEENKVFKKVYS